MLVFVVLGGLGNIWGSLIAAAALTILPEALRPLHDYRCLLYTSYPVYYLGDNNLLWSEEAERMFLDRVDSSPLGYRCV